MHTPVLQRSSSAGTSFLSGLLAGVHAQAVRASVPLPLLLPAVSQPCACRADASNGRTPCRRIADEPRVRPRTLRRLRGAVLVGSFHGIKSYVVCAPTPSQASVAMREGEKASSLNKLDSLYRVLLLQARSLALAPLRMLPRCRFGAGSSSFGGTTNCWSNLWPPFERCARERG